MLNARSIARRMFVTNSFDGLLTTLGIVLGAHIAGIKDPIAYVGTVLGASFSMGVFSGMIATYFSERAERLRELKEMEKQMLHELRGSVYEKAVRFVPLYVALWSGMGIVLLPFIGVTPFLLLPIMGVTSIAVMVYSSVCIVLLEMFLLGFYLGKIAGENPVQNGLKLLGIGGLAATVLTLIELLT
jgi:predicted membrane protein (TIGR00267 family)